MCTGRILQNPISKPTDQIWKTFAEIAKFKNCVINSHRTIIFRKTCRQDSYRNPHQGHGLVWISISMAAHTLWHDTSTRPGTTSTHHRRSDTSNVWSANSSHSTTVARPSWPLEQQCSSSSSRSLCGHVTSVFKASKPDARIERIHHHNDKLRYPPQPFPTSGSSHSHFPTPHGTPDQVLPIVSTPVIRLRPSAVGTCGGRQQLRS